MHDKNPHIVLLSETHWKENKNKKKENKKSGPVFNGYNIVRADRKKGKGGGVAILIHTSISFKEITLPKIDCMEIVGGSISTDSGLVDFISVYCPRGNSTTQQVCQLFDAPGNQFVIEETLMPIINYGRRRARVPIVAVHLWLQPSLKSQTSRSLLRRTSTQECVLKRQNSPQSTLRSPQPFFRWTPISKSGTILEVTTFLFLSHSTQFRNRQRAEHPSGFSTTRNGTNGTAL